MSKTRKIRKARQARNRALAEAASAAKYAEHMEQRTAKALFNFSMLTNMVGSLGNTNLFYAMVHGVHTSGVRTLNPEVSVREVSNMPKRKLEGMASMASLATVNVQTLDVLEAFIKEKADEVGHVMHVEYKGKRCLALDLDALKYMPERYLARELGEIFAEELKGVHRV